MNDRRKKPRWLPSQYFKEKMIFQRKDKIKNEKVWENENRTVLVGSSGRADCSVRSFQNIRYNPALHNILGLRYSWGLHPYSCGN